MGKFKDLTGQRFGRLTVIKLGERNIWENWNYIWVCKCDCGNIKNAQFRCLINGHTTSCGCLRKKPKTKRVCKLCGKNFETKTCRLKKGRGVFCSRQCVWNYWRTKEVLEKRIKSFKENGLSLGNKNINWKGKKVGYSALHHWVKRHLGKPNKCSKCENTNKIQWANKSHKYLRKLTDWIPLCVTCHRKYDKGNDWGSITKIYEKTPSGGIGRKRIYRQKSNRLV